MGMETIYQANAARYDAMAYRRCGHSGLKLPAISLGLWHNFGETTPHATKREMCLTFRPCKQLRPALRQRRDRFWANNGARSSAVP